MEIENFSLWLVQTPRHIPARIKIINILGDDQTGDTIHMHSGFPYVVRVLMPQAFIFNRRSLQYALGTRK